MSDKRLAGRTAVITGAADGIGQGIARRFVREGAAVLVADFDEEKGRQATAELKEIGAEAEFFRCDVTNQSDVEGMIASSVDHFGTIDILVNNAYRGSGVAHVEKIPDDQFDQEFKMNFWGPKWAMVAALPHMRARGWGRIINVCSLNGVNAHIGTAGYNASKEALRTLTRTVAREWAGHGICANIICPAAASASFRRFSGMQPELAAASSAANPMGRMGDPEQDIGAVAYFLASEDARYVTGNTIFADGGAHINGVAWVPELPE